MDSRDLIVCDPEILMGKPTIRGTRISVERILGWLDAGWPIEQILENYTFKFEPEVRLKLKHRCVCVCYLVSQAPATRPY